MGDIGNLGQGYGVGAHDTGGNGDALQNPGGFLGFGGGTEYTNVYGRGYDANAYNNAANAQGKQLYGQQGPTIDQSGGAAYNQAMQGSIMDARTAAAQAQQTALGKGAAIDASNQAVQQQFAANLGQQLNASAALANSGRGGGPGLAAIQGGAGQELAQQSSTNAQNAGMAAAQARAALMSQANQQYGQLSLGAGGLAAQGQQQAYGISAEQAKLQAQQNALNQQGLLGSETLGQNALFSQQTANSNALANQYGLAGTNAQAGGQVAGAGIAAGGSALAALAAA